LSFEVGDEIEVGEVGHHQFCSKSCLWHFPNISDLIFVWYVCWGLEILSLEFSLFTI